MEAPDEGAIKALLGAIIIGCILFGAVTGLLIGLLIS